LRALYFFEAVRGGSSPEERLGFFVVDLQVGVTSEVIWQ
jgi:hypothetical protein